MVFNRDFGFGTDVKLPLVMEGSIMIKLLPKWNKGYEEFAKFSIWVGGMQVMLQSAISSLSSTAILPRRMGIVQCGDAILYFVESPALASPGVGRVGKYNLPLFSEGLIIIKLLPKWNKGYEDFALYGPVRQGMEVFATISSSSTNKETTSVGVTLQLVSPPAPQMDAIEAASSFENRNHLPERLLDQMLSHLCLKFRTDSKGLHQQESRESLPKSIHSSISHFLFYNLVNKAYLFRRTFFPALTEGEQKI
ncbi:hypothetical protein C5167_043641 [Papaver somniferum]|uniref:Uncharacterized protein n=1 Tax=Papaver somniferum TaxID=3469 RepID=A0A4Y7LA66_PAPSO|nr:hypothetical protein C5167_043641 [Papaver somniferum]